MSNISRRSLLGTALIGAASMATAVTLGGCAPRQASLDDEQGDPGENSPESPAWTKENPQLDYKSCTTDFSALFTEITVGKMHLRNRLCKSAAGSDTGASNSPTLSQNTIDYYGRFADGGAALVILEEGTVGSLGLNPFRKMLTKTVEEGIAEAKKIVDRVHSGGACIGTQIGIGTPTDPGDVNAYTTDEVKNMVAGIAKTAGYVKQAGFDCIEVKGATNDGLNQFLSRSRNNRTDEYSAATEENRVRFFKEIIESIRAECGEDFTIIVLINAVEENDSAIGSNSAYIQIEEAQSLAKTLEEAGADMIQVRVGTPLQEANCWASDVMHCVYGAHGSTGSGSQFNFESHFCGLMDGSHGGAGAFIPLASAVKSVVSVPVGCASFMDPNIAPDLIDGAVRDGLVDLVFMNRPLTVDPQLPNKIKDGRRDEVAPCCRCFHCHGKPYGEAEVCRVNPTTQFAYTPEFPEGYDLSPAETPKRVLVIGGGAAGMEAAITAAARGHKVTLAEEDRQLGGLLRFADAVKGGHENIGELRNYLARQLEINGVEIKTETQVTTDLVKQEAPEFVIVAVGGTREERYPDTVKMDEFATTDFGSSAVILGANLQATDIAQRLMAKGVNVTILNEKDEDAVDAEQSYWVRKYAKAHLSAHGTKILSNVTIKQADRNTVTYLTPTGIEKTIAADSVLECFDMKPNLSLYEEITNAGFEAVAVGCDAPKNMQSAIHAGYKAARYL